MCLAMAGCGVSDPVTPDESYTPSLVALDGSTHEWPEDAALVADERYLFFRVSLPDDDHALQAAPTTLAMWLDLDSSTETGLVREGPRPARTMGIDLEVLFSPPRPDGTPGMGVAINSIDSAGVRTSIDHAEIDFMFSPTHASSWYEGRIARVIEERLGTDGAGATGMFIVLESGSPTNLYSDPFSADLPARESRGHAYAMVPDKDPDSIRVMSWNVLRDSPVENAAPFARVIDAIDPDVILFQEWDYSAPQLNGWFTALIETTRWHTLANDTWGVSIVSRYPMEQLGEQIDLDDREVRFIAGMVTTPMGPIAVGSTHLKCCGGAGGDEDLRRVSEAEAINERMAAWLEANPASALVIGGDMNLVGSRVPLEALIERLDLDDTDLSVAEGYVLGDAAQYTWSDAGNAFTPGRLDYLLVSDAGAEIVRSFVLDTNRLSDQALSRMGLRRDDTGASDHMPLVVDLRMR